MIDLTLVTSIFSPFSPLKAPYGPGQPPSLVFATPPPPQMNSAPQARQVFLTAYFSITSVRYAVCFALYENPPFPRLPQKFLARLFLL